MNLSRLARRWRLRRSDPARKRRGKRRFIKTIKTAAVLGSIGGLGFLVDHYAPHQHLPWRTLNPEAPAGFATGLQLTRLALSPSASCMDMARGLADMRSIPADPKDGDGPCGWEVARLMYGTQDVSLSPGEATLQCPLAVGQYIWLAEIDRLAKKQLGSGLSKIHHAGSYSCRRQRGNSSGAWSEHAFANAFDVTGFTLADGRVVSVLKDWDGERGKKYFLRDVRDAACKVFRVTLSPDFNTAHADHFHLDMGPQSACR